ncbi:hypothetical protein PFISCL1PPCAC_15755, partial [Pristionchus fissidentatus]
SHFRKMYIRNEDPEYHIHAPNSPHLVHSTEAFGTETFGASPVNSTPLIEKTCISQPTSKSKSNRKPIEAKECPLSDDLSRVPVVTPIERTDETVDTQTGPIKV